MARHPPMPSTTSCRQRLTHPHRAVHSITERLCTVHTQLLPTPPTCYCRPKQAPRPTLAVTSRWALGEQQAPRTMAPPQPPRPQLEAAEAAPHPHPHARAMGGGRARVHLASTVQTARRLDPCTAVSPIAPFGHTRWLERAQAMCTAGTDMAARAVVVVVVVPPSLKSTPCHYSPFPFVVRCYINTSTLYHAFGAVTHALPHVSPQVAHTLVLAV